MPNEETFTTPQTPGVILLLAVWLIAYGYNRYIFWAYKRKLEHEQFEKERELWNQRYK